MAHSNSVITVCALYKFVRLNNFEQLRKPLQQCLDKHQVRGTLLLAEEGINGTIAGAADGIEAVLAWLNTDARLTDIETKRSNTQAMPFKRAKIKLKKEIVTMGVQGIDPLRVVGTYVAPNDWNALISDPEVTVIDCRNQYEYEVGSFTNAINPATTNFRQFPEYAAKSLDKDQHKKVALFCTGGIRCEKSTAYLKEQGFDEVYHLKGGILKYLENVDEAESLWEGECFVFDERVTVDHGLQKGSYDQCHACRMPITEQDKLGPHYVLGISCHHCYASSSKEQKASFGERQKQLALAKQRGEAHMGQEATEHIKQAKAAKKRQRLQQKKPSHTTS